MKHKAKSLDFTFADDSFALIVEHTTDGERLQKEKEKRETDRAKSDQQQTQLNLCPKTR